MKQRRLVSAVAALTAAGVLGVGLTAASSAAPANPAPRPQKVVINCLGKPQVRPGSFVLACADGNAFLSTMSWTSWTTRLASGSATFVENDCVPYCAAGHFHSYPALVVFWGSGPVAGHPAMRRYTELTMIFTGPRPVLYVNGKPTRPLTQTWPLYAPS